MPEFNCPYCNQRIAVSKAGSFGADWEIMRPLADSSRHRYGDTAPTVPEFTEARRVSPARPASVESDVSVPLLQSMITGVVVSIGTTFITIAVHWPIWAIPTAGGIAVVVSWSLLLVDHRGMLKTVETIINRDLDRDKQIGPVAPPPVRVEYHEQDDQRDRTVFADLPTPRRGYAGLVMFANDVIAGSPFSERTASAHGYSREAWQDLRDEFIDQRWATWNHPNEPKQGVTLLRAGQMILRKVSEGGMPREDFRPGD